MVTIAAGWTHRRCRAPERHRTYTVCGPGIVSVMVLRTHVSTSSQIVFAGMLG